MSLEKRLRQAMPPDQALGRLLRQFKFGLYELLWTVKPEWSRPGESPEIAQLRGLRQASPQPDAQPNPGGKRILLFSMRSWRIHKFWEAIIARGLAERGAEVSVVVCDGLPRCDMYKLHDAGRSRVRCQACSLYTRQVFGLFGLPVQLLSDFIQAPERDEARTLAEGWPGDDLEAFAAEGLPLGELVRPSLMRTMLGSYEPDPVSLRAYRQYLEGGILLARAFRRMLDAFQPETMILLNGMFFAERIGLAIAQERGLHTVSHERGFMRNHLVLAHDEPANWFRVDDAWMTAGDKPLSAEEEARLTKYLLSRQTGAGEVVNYWPTVEERHDFILNQLGLNPNKPIVTTFTNILWDTAVYERDVAFEGMFDWLGQTIDLVAGMPDVQLVIRIHPAEVRLPQKTRERVADRLAERYESLPPNVVVVPSESDLSSYALVDLSTAVNVYTSTIGLEAALRGVPVLVSGQTHYRGKGFTHDVDSPESYAALLQTVPSWQRLDAAEVARARSYARFFFLGNMLPIDLVTERDDGSVQLNLASFDDLKAGRHEVLDHICTAIVQKEMFTRV